VAVLSTGAEARVTGSGPDTVVCVNGGQARDVEGTWSASLEWLVDRLAPRLPHLRFVEVRYRSKSWRRLDLCIDDTTAAVREPAGSPIAWRSSRSVGGASTSCTVARPPAPGYPGSLAGVVTPRLRASASARHRRNVRVDPRCAPRNRAAGALGRTAPAPSRRSMGAPRGSSARDVLRYATTARTPYAAAVTSSSTPSTVP
jgi:hypothetical protein